MKNLLISLIFISSICTQVTAANQLERALNFMLKNKPVFISAALGLSGAALGVMYKIFMPADQVKKHAKTLSEIEDESGCKLIFDANGNLLHGLMEINGKTVQLTPDAAVSVHELYS